jgi:hypothetical protein
MSFKSPSNVDATAGTNGRGGGGGGGSNTSGAKGGTGIVIIRYKTDGSDGVSTSSTGGTITTSGAYTIHSFTTGGTFGCVLAGAATSTMTGVLSITGLGTITF